MEHLEKSTPPGPKPLPGAVWVDRQDEAQDVLDFVLSAESRVVLLFGKHGIGKTSLVLHWVIPSALKRQTRQEAFYGDCSQALPERVSGPSGDLDLWTAAARPGLIFLDSFERLLDLPDDRREELLAGFCARVRSPEHAAILVLIFDETRLGRAFALRSYLPEVAHAAREIKGVPAVDSAAALQSVAHQQGLDCEPAVLDVLAAEAAALDSRGEGVSPDLLHIVSDQLQRLRQVSQQPLDLAEYRAMGGVENLLRGFLDRRLGELGVDGGVSREVSLAILEEVATARRAGRAPELSGLAERLEITDTELQRALSGLQGSGGLLRQHKSGGVEVVPGLAAVMDKEAARRRLETRESQWILREGVKAWAQVETLPARETFARIEAQRRRLEVNDDEAALALQCALRYHGEEDLGSARYWLRRIRSEEARVEPLLLALFDPLPMVRAKAAALLADSRQPEVREQLHLLALKDEEPKVRTAAVHSLREMKSKALRELLVQEAKDQRSPYREQAIDALRIFPEERTIAVLRNVVGDGASPASLRSKAIEVLAAMQVSAATEALVEIALHDEDRDDRHAAAMGLGSRQAEILVRDSLERLRAARSSAEKSYGLARLRSYLPSVGRAVLAVLVVFANLYLHGLALLVLRRYWLGSLVLSVEAASVWLINTSIVEGCLGGFLLLLVSFYAGQILPAGLLLRQRKAGRLEEGTFHSALALMLFASTTLSAVLWLHGLAHALIGRWRRAAALFVCEILGLALLWMTPLGKMEAASESLWQFYFFWLGVLLFVGSLVYDVARVLRDSALRNELAERRWDAYRELLRGRVAPALVLERLGSADRKDARWARSLLRRCGAAIEPELLLGYLQGEGPARRFAIRHLAQNKREELIQRLCSLWRDADESLRRTLLAILARRPTEASLAALRRLQPLSFGQRLRTKFSRWQFRFRVWPRTVLVSGLLALPLIVAAIYVGVDVTLHNYRPQLWVVQNPKEPPDRRVATAEYLAKVYPSEAFKPLTRIFRDTAEANVEMQSGIAHSLGIIATQAMSSNIRQQAGAELIEGLKRWSDSKIREAIVGELATIGRAEASDLSIRDINAKLGQILQNASDPGLRRAALEVLEAARAVDVLRDFVASPDALGIQRGRPRSEELARRREDDALRREAILALGRIGTLESIQALRKLHSAPLPEALAAQVRKELSHPLQTLEAGYEEGRYSPVIQEAQRLLDAPEMIEWRSQILNLLGKAECSSSLPEPDLASSASARDRCIQYLEEARAAGGIDPEARGLLARSYVTEAESRRAAGRREEALALTQAALRVAPSSATAHALRGVIYSELGSQEAALGSLDAAIQNEPEEGSIYLTEKAQLLLDAKQFEPAREALLAAIEQDPDDSWSVHLLAQSYLQQGRPLEAERELLSLRQRYPASSGIGLALTSLYHEDLSRRDDRAYEKALQEIDRVGKLNPNPLIQANLAEAQLTTGRFLEAAETAREVLDGSAGDQETELNVRFIQFAALLLAGEPGEADEALEELEASYSSLPETFSNGWAYAGTSRYLRKSKLPLAQQESLLALCELIQTRQPGAQAQKAFAAMRASLRQGL